MATKRNKAAEEEATRRILEYLPKTKKGGKTYSEIKDECITKDVHTDEFYITGAEIGAAMNKLNKSGKIKDEFRDLHNGKHYEGARYYWQVKEDKK